MFSHWYRTCLITLAGSSLAVAHGQLPDEPLDIPRGVPQFVHDSWLIDNHWALRYKHQAVTLVAHAPQKAAANPFQIFAADNPSYAWVIRDTLNVGSNEPSKAGAQTRTSAAQSQAVPAEDGPTQGVFRMYYQANHRLPDAAGKGPKYRSDVAYAESTDGVHWVKPDLNLFPEKQYARPNNIVIGHDGDAQVQSSAPMFPEQLPETDRRGYKRVMIYRAKGRGDVAGIHAAGTHDGIHFDMANDVRIAHLHSDCANSISYDPIARDFVMFCRAKQMYRAFGDEMIDTGASRRIATMRSPRLWCDWLQQDAPRTLLIPDNTDSATNHNFFYGMPTVYRHGLFWGALQAFRMNDLIHTELVTSRDGVHWNRAPARKKLITYGPDGSWDDTMIFVSPRWLEVGHEWWFYYCGFDGPHGTADRTGMIGLATCERERVFSLRGPQGGGVICTRSLVWPGGDLWLNAAAAPDAPRKLSVRISDAKRRPVAGFDHQQSLITSAADPTRQVVTWNDRTSLDLLTGQTIRIEIFLQNADLFSLGASAAE